MSKTKMKKSKKAQYYIVTAMILLLLASGIILSSGRLNQREDKLKTLGENFQSESTKVYNYALRNGTNMTKFVSLFTSDFSSYAKTVDSNAEFVYVIINRENIFVKNSLNRAIKINSTTIAGGSNVTVAKKSSIKINVFNVDYNISRQDTGVKALIASNNTERLQVRIV